MLKLTIKDLIILTMKAIGTQLMTVQRKLTMKNDVMQLMEANT